MTAAVTVAHKDVNTAVRSRALWVSTALLAVLVLSGWWSTASWASIEQTDYPFLTAIEQFELWLPLFAIVLGYRSVIGERESGRIRLLLGQPGTRRDVVLGAFLGRSFVVGIAVALVLTQLAVLVIAQLGIVSPIQYASGVVLLALFGLAWVGTTVGVSSFVGTERRAVGIMVGLYALCTVLWDEFVIGLFSLAITGSTDPGVDRLAVLASLEDPTWYLYVNRLNPFAAFEGALYYVPNALELVLLGDQMSHPHAPNLFGIGVLLAWATLPIVAGYRRFQRAELR